jgi:hypothetical protein
MPQIPCASDFEIPEKTNKSTQYFKNFALDKDNKAVHKHVVCNDCKAYPIIGTRYKCLDIDMDLCSKCINKNTTPFQFKAIEKPQKKRYIGKFIRKMEKNAKKV